MNKWVVTALCLLLAGQVSAQDWSLEPAYGTQNLAAGFEPDPTEIEMVPGGSVDLSASETVDISVYGWVAEAPDLDLNYEAGDYILTIAVEGGGMDTLLLVNAPDGQWYFNDDCVDLNPSISFEEPLTGMYNIWVGTYSESEQGNVVLFISEKELACD